MTRPQSTVILFPASRVNVFIDYQHISSSLASFLHDRFTTEQHGQYMEKKYHWTPTTRSLIAWNIHHRTLNNQPSKQHQQVLKYIYEWLPTGREVHRHDKTEDHKCPHCYTVYECKPASTPMSEHHKSVSKTTFLDSYT